MMVDFLCQTFLILGSGTVHKLQCAHYEPKKEVSGHVAGADHQRVHDHQRVRLQVSHDTPFRAPLWILVVDNVPTIDLSIVSV